MAPWIEGKPQNLLKPFICFWQVFSFRPLNLIFENHIDKTNKILQNQMDYQLANHK
jgi:hypothetical protein